MAKFEIKGWTGKSEKLPQFISRIKKDGFTQYDFVLEHSKGRKTQWSPTDWPPKRVRITVEEIDEVTE